MPTRICDELTVMFSLKVFDHWFTREGMNGSISASLTTNHDLLTFTCQSVISFQFENQAANMKVWSIELILYWYRDFLSAFPQENHFLPNFSCIADIQIDIEQDCKIKNDLSIGSNSSKDFSDFQEKNQKQTFLVASIYLNLWKHLNFNAYEANFNKTESQLSNSKQTEKSCDLTSQSENKFYIFPPDSSQVYTEKYKENLEGRRLGSVSKKDRNLVACIQNQYCVAPIGGFNLLNTGVITGQKDCWPDASVNSNALCDCIITDQFPYTGMKNQKARSATIASWWSAKFPASTTVQTVLILNVVTNGGSSVRLQSMSFTIGNNADVTLNPICASGIQAASGPKTITDGGLWSCVGTGMNFGMFTTDKYFTAMEIAVFNLPQVVPASAIMSTNFNASFLPSNMLSNIMITDHTISSITLTAPANCQASDPNNLLPSAALTFAASVFIQLVILLPSGFSPLSSDAATSWIPFQNNVDVFVVNSSGNWQCCGNSGDYNTYTEVKCGFTGNQVILKKSTANLRFCGVGILSGIPSSSVASFLSTCSSCNCSTSSFTNVNFLSQTAIFAKQGDASISIQVIILSDTVSNACGNNDGITACGARQISFQDNQIQITSMPYNGLTWDSVSSNLIFNPSDPQATSTNITVTIRLINYQSVTQSNYLQLVITQVAQKLVISPLTYTLSTVIGAPASIKLQNITSQYHYVLKSTQSYQVNITDFTLTAFSSNPLDAGSKTLLLSVMYVDGSNSTTISINIMFNLDEIVANSTETNDNTENTTDSQSQQPVSQSVINNKSTLNQNETTQNWLAEYQKVIESRNSNTTLIKPLTARISKVSNYGEVKIEFSKKMVIPPSYIIENYMQPGEDARIPALILNVIPSNFSIKSLLDFTYNITDYEGSMMTIQLNFTDAVYVSTSRHYDKLEIIFYQNLLFFDVEGQVINNNLTLSYIMPPQLQYGSQSTDNLKQLVITSRVVAQVTMASSFAVNFLLSAALNILFSTIKSQQLYTLMSLFNLQLPANTAVFYGFLMQIASFDSLPVTKLYPLMAPNMIQTSALTPNFDQVGLSDLYFLNNMGSLFLAFLVFPVQLILCACLIPFKKQSARVRQLMQSIWNSAFWTHTLKIIIESYAIVMICVFLNFLNVSLLLVTFQLVFSDWWSFVNSILALCFGAVFFGLPVAASIMMWLNFDVLQNTKVKRLWGSYYKELNLKSGKQVIFYMFFFFIRRAVLAAIAIFDNQKMIQFMCMIYTVIINFSLIYYTSPFSSGRFAKYNEKLNEVVMMLIMYTNLCFTDFVPNPVYRFGIGYVTISIISTHLLVNLILIAVQSVRFAMLKVKQIKYRLKLKAIHALVKILAKKRIEFSASIHRKEIVQFKKSSSKLKLDIVQEVEQNEEQSNRILRNDKQRSKLRNNDQALITDLQPADSFEAQIDDIEKVANVDQAIIRDLQPVDSFEAQIDEIEKFANDLRVDQTQMDIHLQEFKLSRKKDRQPTQIKRSLFFKKVKQPMKEIQVEHKEQ